MNILYYTVYTYTCIWFLGDMSSSRGEGSSQTYKWNVEMMTGEGEKKYLLQQSWLNYYDGSCTSHY